MQPGARLGLVIVLAGGCSLGSEEPRTEVPAPASNLEREEPAETRKAGGPGEAETELPPPPERVLEAQRRLSRLPRGILRRADGRLFCEDDGAEMVLVRESEAGSAAGAVATPAEGGDPSRPGAPFLLDRLEVTVERFRKFCEESGLAMPKQPPDSTARHPVVWVKWSEAVEYAAWSWRRLPREEEWERAARGPDALAYPWGNSDDERRRNGPGSEDGFPRLAPVGSFPSGASPDGALDLAGNVWEWCLEWNEPLRLMKIIRGGSWFNDRTCLRGSHRAWDHPDFGGSTIGFRCAVSVP